MNECHLFASFMSVLRKTFRPPYYGDRITPFRAGRRITVQKSWKFQNLNMVVHHHGRFQSENLRLETL